jgi:hypothetical protein
MTPFFDTGYCRSCYLKTHGTDSMSYVENCVNYARRILKKEDAEYAKIEADAAENEEKIPEQKRSVTIQKYEKYIDEVEDDLWECWDKLKEGNTKVFKKFQTLLAKAQELLPDVNEDEEWDPEKDAVENHEREQYGLEIVNDSDSVGQEEFSSSEEEFEVAERRRKATSGKKRGRSTGGELADEVLKELGRVPIEEVRTELITLYNEQKLDEVRSSLKRLPKSAFRIKLNIPGVSSTYYPMMYKSEQEATNVAKGTGLSYDIEEHKLV